MRRWLVRLALVLALVVVAIGLRFTFFRSAPIPVTVFVVAPGRVEETVSNSKAGTLKSRHRARLSPEIGGRVAAVRVRKGDSVKAGDVLVRLDDTQYRAHVANAERALDAARQEEKEACLATDLAEKDLARAEDLARDRILSQELLDQSRSKREIAGASCEAARARVAQLGAQIQVARAELAKTVIRAPFGGVVAELTAELGEWVTPSPPGIPMPAVLDLIDTDTIYVSAPLDEVDREKVSVGQRARVTIDAYPGRSFPGSVTRIAPYIADLAEQSRTFEVEATLDDARLARTLPPGASADIEVMLRARDGVLRVPAYAVVEGKRALILDKECASGGGLLGSFGRLLSAAGTECVVARAVETGLKNWEFIEITAGLKAGDRVVVSLDRAEVKEGARVRQTAVAQK